MSVFEALESPKHFGGGDTTSRMLVGHSCRERTSRRQSASLACTYGVRGTWSLQRRSAWGWQKIPALTEMEITRLWIVPSGRCERCLEVSSWYGGNRYITLLALERRVDRR